MPVNSVALGGRGSVLRRDGWGDTSVSRSDLTQRRKADAEVQSEENETPRSRPSAQALWSNSWKVAKAFLISPTSPSSFSASAIAPWYFRGIKQVPHATRDPFGSRAMPLGCEPPSIEAGSLRSCSLGSRLRSR